MKLILRHLSAYLPYKLILVKEGFPHVELQSLNVNTDYSYWKPLLKPMSDLTKVVTLDGETATYIEHLNAEAGINNEFSLEGRYVMFTPEKRAVYNLCGIPLEAIDFLLTHHFDVYNLIACKKAIDINTLKDE